MSGPRLVLASASPRRADVLRQLGLSPQILPADVDESYLPGETPTEHVERLARAKASAAARGEQGTLVVGGDTIVLDGEVVLGKPSGPEQAVEMLMALSGRSHEVISGIAIAGAHGMVSRVVRTGVSFREMSVEEARRYVDTGEPLDKAGAYGIQGLGAALVTGLDGDYYSVVGFPVAAFVDLLAEAGWRYDFGALTPTG
jgi:nucleoside triphosphate pyrophosphatase